MRVGSLFSGVGGFDLGLERAGHEIVWQVEFDKQCRSVLRHHWPNADLYEDVNNVGRATLAPCDILCGGFPCQDLSVAGGRKGLAGERSGLWGEFHRIIGELSPTWLLIENVPGLLSSNEGRDMAVIVHGLEELGYGWSYRILDSQYFGVPQRRRRVFIVGHSGGVCGPEILLECESVYGDIEEVGEAGEEVAGTSGEGSQGPDIDSPFVLRKAQKAHDPDDCERWEDADKSNTLSAHGTTTSEVALVETYHDLAPTMFASGAGVERVASAGSEAQFIVGAIQQVQWASGGGKVLNDSAQTLRSGAEHNYQFLNTAIPRRLTPTECERLQGFPDDWTRYADDGTELADGPRYRMMGNAVTVNVAEWIGRRLPSEEG